MGSSPLSRGIPGVVREDIPGRGIIPALAGNTTTAASMNSSERDHPRSRGEYASPRQPPPTRHGSSPLSRGIHWDRGHQGSRGGIIPALAGNTISCMTHFQSPSDHPRSRGEYEFVRRLRRDGLGSSPLSRGIRVLNESPDLAVRIIPALAGNTSCRAGGFPCRHGSSPLSRGILHASSSPRLGWWIIPALAGNTHLPTIQLKNHSGSSPLSRGIRGV